MGDMPEILYNLLAKGKGVLWSSQDKQSCKVCCISLLILYPFFIIIFSTIVIFVCVFCARIHPACVSASESSNIHV
mgnify:FL=1